MVYRGLCLLTLSLYHDAATSVDMAYGRPEEDLTSHRKHIPSLKRVREACFSALGLLHD